MSARIAFESWQLLFPVIGFGIFATIFLGVLFLVVRMKSTSVSRIENLPLEDEFPRPARHVHSK